MLQNCTTFSDDLALHIFVAPRRNGGNGAYVTPLSASWRKKRKKAQAVKEEALPVVSRGNKRRNSALVGAVQVDARQVEAVEF